MLGSGMLVTLSWVADCKFDSAKCNPMVLIADMRRFVGGVIYWYLWTVLIPHWGGYHLEEEGDVLHDGTSVTKLVKVKDK